MRRRSRPAAPIIRRQDLDSHVVDSGDPFAVKESAILVLPIYHLHDVHHRYFWPVHISAWIIAGISFICFILVIRRWDPTRNRIRAS